MKAKKLQFTDKSIKLQVLTLLLLLFALLAPDAFAKPITEKNVLIEVNAARQSEKVPLLVENSQLDKAAKDKADDMIKNNYFAHVSPTGATPWQWIIGSGYDYKYAGENLAINFSKVEDQQKAWMNSPSHRKNILNGDYKEIGIAVANGFIDGKESIITVQMFGTRMEEIAPANSQVSSNQNQAVLAATSEKNILNNSLSLKNFWVLLLVISIPTILVDILIIVKKRFEKRYIAVHH